jgi:hypothetical protein
MNLIRKNYDIDAETQASAPSIAELMAKNGNINGVNQESPVNIKEQKSTEATPSSSAAKANDGAEAERKTESSSQEKQEATSDKSQKATEENTQFNLQEVLRNQQPDFILKELGYDEKKIGFIQELKDLDPKMVEFLNVWKTNGDVTGYLKEMSTDYSKLPAEEVMRYQLREEYPKASEKQLEVLFQREVINAYSLDPERFTDEEIEEGKELLEAKVSKYRDTLVEKQQNFLLPKAQSVDNDAEQQDALLQMEAYKQSVNNDPYAKDVFGSKQIAIGEGDSKFNFSVEPNDITEMLYDSDKWYNTMFEKKTNQNGQEIIVPNVKHQLLIATVAKYGESFLNALAKHYTSIGAKQVIDPIDNPSQIGGSTPSKSASEPTSIAGMMAKRGMVR